MARTFRIPSGNRQIKILIDPFFTGNPSFDESSRKDAAAGLTHVLLTHGHGDHVGDTIALAKETGATVVANADLAAWLGSKGVQALEMGNTGGTIHLDGFSTTFVNALAFSGAADRKTASRTRSATPTVLCCISRMSRRFTIWAIPTSSPTWGSIHELHQPEIGLVPIGDRFTMGGAVAALACQRFFKFATVLPCHYGSFGIIDQTPDLFIAAMDGASAKVEAPAVGGIVAV